MKIYTLSFIIYSVNQQAPTPDKDITILTQLTFMS
jgi:hypothetical protein